MTVSDATSRVDFDGLPHWLTVTGPAPEGAVLPMTRMRAAAAPATYLLTGTPQPPAGEFVVTITADNGEQVTTHRLTLVVEEDPTPEPSAPSTEPSEPSTEPSEPSTGPSSTSVPPETTGPSASASVDPTTGPASPSASDSGSENGKQGGRGLAETGGTGAAILLAGLALAGLGGALLRRPRR